MKVSLKLSSCEQYKGIHVIPAVFLLMALLQGHHDKRQPMILWKARLGRHTYTTVTSLPSLLLAKLKCLSHGHNISYK